MGVIDPSNSVKNKLYTLYITLDWCDEGALREPVSTINRIRALTPRLKDEMELEDAKAIWEQREVLITRGSKPEVKILVAVDILELKEWFKRHGTEYPNFRVTETSPYDQEVARIKKTTVMGMTGAVRPPPLP